VHRRLPAPVLCRSAKLPTGRGWRYEPRLDGFRCASTRRKASEPSAGAATTSPISCLNSKPSRPSSSSTARSTRPTQNGAPDFHRLCARFLHGTRRIPVVYGVFDLLAVDGIPTLGLPHRNPKGLNRLSNGATLAPQ
jgi:hypothetical protein